MGRHNHYPHATHVHGKFQFQNIRFFCLDCPGLQEQDHRIEAVVLAGVLYGVFVTANGCQRNQFAAISANHLVVEVPGLYAKGFGLVHAAPGIRSLEGGKVKKAFVHYGKRIGHGLPALFRNLYGELFFRMKHARKRDYGVKVRARIFHVYSLDSIQPQGEVVDAVSVRLEEAYIDKEVGRHFRCNRHFKRCIIFRCVYPCPGKHSAGVFNGHQSLAILGCRYVYHGFFPNFVGRFVRREGEHCEGLGILS